jgi:hypothetical protein
VGLLKKEKTIAKTMPEWFQTKYRIIPWENGNATHI